MHKAHHVYKKDMSLPRAQSEGEKRMKKEEKKLSGYHCSTMKSRVPLLVSSKQTQPRLRECFFV